MMVRVLSRLMLCVLSVMMPVVVVFCFFKNKQQAVCRELLNAKANPDRRDRYKRTPLDVVRCLRSFVRCSCAVCRLRVVESECVLADYFVDGACMCVCMCACMLVKKTLLVYVVL